MKHTPTPWVADSSKTKTAINSGHKHIAMVNWFRSKNELISISVEEHEANVRLIEAAPEMLEALEAWVNHINVCVGADGASVKGYLETMTSKTAAMALTDKVMTKLKIT